MCQSSFLSPGAWALSQFNQVDLGDARRTRRVVQLAAAMAERPEASIPRLMRDTHQAKAMYRLFERSDLVTFDALTEQHQRQTRAMLPAHCRVLLIGDVTEINYTHHPATRGLEMVGDGRGRGFNLHSMLAIDEQKQIIGLARQELFYRQRAPKGETRKERLARDRESLVWSRSVRQGPSPRPGQQLIHVCDAAADDYSFYQACFDKKCDFVNPVRQDRYAALGHDASEKSGTIKNLLRALPPAGGTWFFLQARKKGQKDRWARLLISFSPVTIFPSKLAEKRTPPLRLWAARVWEVDAPPGAEPVEWTLLSSLPMRSLEDALEAMRFYTCRWLIEEYHQCLKSGCAIEKKQLEEADRLEALLGVASIVALRLLTLKQQVQQQPQTPAVQHVEELSVKMLCLRRKIRKPPRQLTLHKFWREVARLGGFLARKSDGEPGWKTLWLGWRELQLLTEGARIALDHRKSFG